MILENESKYSKFQSIVEAKKKKTKEKKKPAEKGLVGLVSDNFGRFGLIPAVADRQSEQISSVTVLSGTG